MLDLLMKVKSHHDGTLAFRKSCARGVCGSDAMRINDEPFLEKERLQSPEERKKFDDATNCILCGACYSAFPVVREKNPEYKGPAETVQAARFLDDSRDRSFVARLDVLDTSNGVWPCENHFRCTVVCPRCI